MAILLDVAPMPTRGHQCWVLGKELQTRGRGRRAVRGAPTGRRSPNRIQGRGLHCCTTRWRKAADGRTTSRRLSLSRARGADDDGARRAVGLDRTAVSLSLARAALMMMGIEHKYPRRTQRSTERWLAGSTTSGVTALMVRSLRKRDEAMRPNRGRATAWRAAVGAAPPWWGSRGPSPRR